MTKEEAIRLIGWLKCTTNREDDLEAIDMAIEALSEVRCNDCKWNDDVIEVVRCKDCRWWQDDYMGTWCGRLSGVRWTNADDFCSWGERKEE